MGFARTGPWIVRVDPVMDLTRVLHTFDRALGGAGIEWQVDTIGSAGAVDELVRRAVDWGAEAVTCMVANSANLGRPGLQFAPDISIDDGLLDVVLLREADLEAMAALVKGARGQTPQTASFLRWKGMNIRIHADPAGEVQVDGESRLSLPLEISVTPGELRMLVPQFESERD